jgi:CDP-6-deoxy-D-xylo-4-hexulose-3-dehydrase
MQQALFLGTYPGLTEAMIDHEVAIIKAFVQECGAGSKQPRAVPT